MADVKVIDIDGEQWNIKDQDAREKNDAQDAKIIKLTSDIDLIKKSYDRFYYDANTDKDVLQNRIDAMFYCYNNSKSSVATIRYWDGYYYQVILPAAELFRNPLFIEIDYYGEINVFQARSTSDYQLVRTIK